MADALGDRYQRWLDGQNKRLRGLRTLEEQVAAKDAMIAARDQMIQADPSWRREIAGHGFRIKYGPGSEAYRQLVNTPGATPVQMNNMAIEESRRQQEREAQQAQGEWSGYLGELMRQAYAPYQGVAGR